MSRRLPSLPRRKVIRALERAGFVRVPKRGAGSHAWMVRDDPPAQTAVPDAKDIPAGTLKAIIAQAGLTREEFLALL